MSSFSQSARSLLFSGVLILVFFAMAHFLKSSIQANPMRSAGSASLGMGILHGAFMPLALVPLLANQDVPIYDVRNTGRPYHIGYIIGVNLCGLIFIPPMVEGIKMGWGLIRKRKHHP